MSEIDNYINSEKKSTYKIPKPEPRDFKGEFEKYLEENSFNQKDFAAFLMIAKTIIFERDKENLLGMAINHTPIGRDDFSPRILHRLRRHDIL